MSNEKEDFYSDFSIQENKIFNSQIRFKIMILLYIQKEIGITDLMNLLKISYGNLDHHLKVLETTGYVTKKSKIFNTRFLVHVKISKDGIKDFKEYSEKLKQMLDKIKS